MISVKDVITLRIPYPDFDSDLAKKSHMLVCIGLPEPHCDLVKCQRFKAYHAISGSLPKHRIVEHPDAARNPFRHPTVIDIDKVFSATHSIIPDSLKAKSGISDSLLAEISLILDTDTKHVSLSDRDLRLVNSAL